MSEQDGMKEDPGGTHAGAPRKSVMSAPEGTEDNFTRSWEAGKASGLPAALTTLIEQDHWLVWRWVVTKTGKPTKVPYQPRRPGSKAETDDPATWSSYAEAVAQAGNFDGIGFCLTDTEFAAFDIDDCRDPATGTIHPWAQKLIDEVGSYTEITVSGTGLRIIGRGTGPEVHRKLKVSDGVTCEVYRRATRYIVMTGNQVGEAEINNIDAAIDRVVAELDKPRAAPKNDEIKLPRELPRELRLMLHLQGDAPAEYASRSELFWAFVCAALRKGIDENEIMDACLSNNYSGHSIYEHVQENGGIDYVKRQIERALNETPTTTGDKVIIRLTGGDLDMLWRQTQDALIRAGQPVYVRGGKLVQPLWRFEKTDEDNRDVLTAEFVRYNIPRLRDVVQHHAAVFEVYDGRMKSYKKINPPKDVIDTLLEAGHWGFLSVVGIVTSPTMRRDGSLLTEPGYDPATRLWYKPSGDVELPDIPEAPTKAEAENALRLLNDELLAEFPFDGENEENKHSISRSVALAGIFTTVLRGAFLAVPIFAIVAPEARTGKTFLVLLISVLATGHVPVPIAGARRPEEMEKRIETAALTGRPILHLNNLPNGTVLESEALSQISTEGQLSIRKLGRHEEGLCDCRATTVFINGNNIMVAADLVPRTPVCRLNANTDQPEARTFSFDPIERVRRNRGKYLAAVFTIARAFMAAGCPRPSGMKSVAGYGEWSRLVQQPLMWLGMADPLGGLEEMRAIDPHREELQRILDVLKKYRSELTWQFSVADCERLAEEMEMGPYDRPRYKRQDLRDLMTIRGGINTRSFGRLLMKHRDRMLDGWSIHVGTGAHKVAAYRLVGPDKPEEPKEEDRGPF